MPVSIDKEFIDQLLAEARRDGIESDNVGAVIMRADKFLLLEREASDFMGGQVELPSGSVDPGEDLLGALAREIREETGLRLRRVIAYLGGFDFRPRSGLKTRQFNFLVEVDPGEIKLSPAEHQAYYFSAPGDELFGELNISDAVRWVLEEVQERFGAAD